MKEREREREEIDTLSKCFPRMKNHFKKTEKTSAILSGVFYLVGSTCHDYPSGFNYLVALLAHISI